MRSEELMSSHILYTWTFKWPLYTVFLCIKICQLCFLVVQFYAYLNISPEYGHIFCYQHFGLLAHILSTYFTCQIILIWFILLHIRVINLGSWYYLMQPNTTKLQIKEFDVLLTVHHSIELFNLPTLIHNSLFINNMYVTLLSSTCFEH